MQNEQLILFALGQHVPTPISREERLLRIKAAAERRKKKN